MLSLLTGARAPGGAPWRSGRDEPAVARSWRLLQVAAKALETGVFGAYFNVLTNLKDITDPEFKEQVSRRRGAGSRGRTWRWPSELWSATGMFLWPPVVARRGSCEDRWLRLS